MNVPWTTWLPVLMTVMISAVIPLVGAVWRSALKQARLEDEIQRQRERLEILWQAKGSESVERLHHATQPEMDSLLDAWKAKSISVEQLGQLLQRLDVVAATEGGPPSTVEAAQFLRIDVAAALAEAKKDAPVQDAAEQMAQMQRDTRMAAATADEAHVIAVEQQASLPPPLPVFVMEPDAVTGTEVPAPKTEVIVPKDDQ